MSKIHIEGLHKTYASRNGRVTAIDLYPHQSSRPFANLANAALYVVRRDSLRRFCDVTGKIDFTKDILPALVREGGSVVAYRSADSSPEV